MLTHLVMALACMQGGEGENEKRTQEAEVIQERAFAAVEEAGKLEGEEKVKAWQRALVEFGRITKDYKDTRFYGMCHYNVGHILCNELGKHEQAIKELEALIASKVDDRDSNGSLMHPYRNYRYYALRIITTCYEGLDKPAHAIESVFRSRTAYVSDCGTCRQQMLDNTRKRLVALAKVIAPGTEEADVDEALPSRPAGAQGSAKDPSALQFLQALERRLRKEKRLTDALKVLRALAEEFPASEEGKAAAKELKEK